MDDSATPSAASAALRVSDAERDAVLGRLQHHYAVGRLTLPELEARVAATVGAHTREQLDGVVADLPDERERAASPAPATGIDSQLLIILLCVAPPAALVYWLVHRRRARPRRARH